MNKRLKGLSSGAFNHIQWRTSESHGGSRGITFTLDLPCDTHRILYGRSMLGCLDCYVAKGLLESMQSNPYEETYYLNYPITKSYT